MISQHVTVTEAARDRNLVELATVQGIRPGADPATLSRVIRAVSEAMAGPAGFDRPPWRQTYKVRVGPVGGPILKVDRFPVESVTVIDSGGTELNDYSLEGARREYLYRETRWPESRVTGRVAGDRTLTFALSPLVAGWLMPGEIETWQQDTDYGGSGEKRWVRASDPTMLVRFEATTAGKSGSSEPSWDTTPNATTVDGTVTWTTREASELPDDVQEVALAEVLHWLGGALAPSGIKAESFDGARIEYMESQPALSPGVTAVCRRYR